MSIITENLASWIYIPVPRLRLCSRRWCTSPSKVAMVQATVEPSPATLPPPPPPPPPRHRHTAAAATAAAAAAATTATATTTAATAATTTLTTTRSMPAPRTRCRSFLCLVPPQGLVMAMVRSHALRWLRCAVRSERCRAVARRVDRAREGGVPSAHRVPTDQQGGRREASQAPPPPPPPPSGQPHTTPCTAAVQATSGSPLRVTRRARGGRARCGTSTIASSTSTTLSSTCPSPTPTWRQSSRCPSSTARRRRCT